MALGWRKISFLLSIFSNWWVLIKFCICIDIYKIHIVYNVYYFCRFSIVLWSLIDDRILFIYNRVMALNWCKNVFFLNIFRRNGWILIKFCVWIDIYKIHVVANARYFWSILNSVMVLDRRQNLFLLNILWINSWISIKFCICVGIDNM